MFASGVFLIGVVRLVCMAAVFALYEAMTGSWRIAAIGCLIYMGSSNYFIFHAGFAYESLAIAFLALLFLVLIAKNLNATAIAVAPRAIVATLLVAALAVTHHLTSYIAAAILSGYAILEMVCLNPRQSRVQGLIPAGLAVVAAYLFFHFVGSSTASYLGPEVELGFGGIMRLITGRSVPRELFVSQSGVALPGFMSAAGFGSAIIVCAALAGGFFRALHMAGLEPLNGWKAMLQWHKSLLVLFTLLTLVYPLALLLRLSPSSWELGNRLGSFLFFAVAIVCAIAVQVQWLGERPGRVRSAIAGLLLTVVFLGGIVAGGATSAVPSRYKVAADSQSVEPMGIETALSIKTWLGPRNRFASDRINRMLLALYGRQTVVTTIQDRVDTSRLFASNETGDYEHALIKEARLDYLLVDLRLSRSLPGVGVFFEKGEPAEVHQSPLSAAALLKFNREPNVNRIFDNGTLVLFDVRGIRD